MVHRTSEAKLLGELLDATNGRIDGPWVEGFSCLANRNALKLSLCTNIYFFDFLLYLVSFWIPRYPMDHASRSTTKGLPAALPSCLHSVIA